MLKAITENHSQTVTSMNKLKQEIECKGDTCKKIDLVPKADYDQYVSRMKRLWPREYHQNYQRKFNALCNGLFDNRADYITHKSLQANNTVNHTPGNLHFNTAKLSKDYMKRDQKLAFFDIRNFSNENDSATVNIHCNELSAIDLVALYFKSNKKEHILGVLLIEHVEFHIKKINVYVGSKLQKIIVGIFISCLDERFKSVVNVIES